MTDEAAKQGETAVATPNPEDVKLDGEGEEEVPAWMQGLGDDGDYKATDNPLGGVTYNADAVKKAADRGKYGDLLPDGKYEATVTGFEPRRVIRTRPVAVITFVTDTHEGEYEIMYWIYPKFENPEPIKEQVTAWFYSDMESINPALRDMTPDEKVCALGLTPDCMKGKRFNVQARRETFGGNERNKFTVSEFRPEER